MPAAAELTNIDVIVAPGDEAQVELRVRNLGNLTETFSFVPTGIAQGWTVVEPPTLTLFPGEVGTAEVVLRPPRSAAVSAGRSPFGVRIVPAGAPDEVAHADASVTVLAYDERSLSIAQPVLRGRRRAEFDVVIENRGNIQASLRLGIRQDARKMSGRFTPPSIGVDPGQSEAVRLPRQDAKASLAQRREARPVRGRGDAGGAPDRDGERHAAAAADGVGAGGVAHARRARRRRRAGPRLVPPREPGDRRRRATMPSPT